jgi:hypothetical protein
MNIGSYRRDSMSDYGSLYLIDTTYNSDSDVTEVIFGYLEREKEVEGRIRKVRVIVNVPGGRVDKAPIIEKGLITAKSVLKSASKAPYEED